MADSTSDTTARAQRRWLYTNVPNAFPGLGDLDDPLFHLTMDTWYYSEWADPNHWVSFGTLPLGDGPLRGQGVAAFVARQVALFLDAFSGVFRPTAVRMWYKPQLTGVVHHAFGFSAPETQEDVQAIQSALEQSAYDGIDWLTIDFEVGATVRDEGGQFTEIWLPYAGTAHYHAHYTDGYSSDPPKYGAVTYLLTPEAKAGMVRGPWICTAGSFPSSGRPTPIYSPAHTTTGRDGSRGILPLRIWAKSKMRTTKPRAKVRKVRRISSSPW